AEQFFTIAVAFVSATLLGFASHAPGSLGVFDAAMLVAPPEIPKEELVAGLLVFRMYISWSHFASLSLPWRAGNPSCSCAVAAWRLRNEGPNLQKRRPRRRTKTSRRIQGWVERLRNPS